MEGVRASKENKSDKNIIYIANSYKSEPPAAAKVLRYTQRPTYIAEIHFCKYSNAISANISKP